MAANGAADRLSGPGRDIQRVATFDEVRGWAILIVLGFHAGVPGLDGGFIGVDIFFVLSGFLISRNLCLEFAQSHFIDLARFYNRRVLRLLPAAGALTATYLLFAPTMFSLTLGASALDAWFVLSTLSGYTKAFINAPEHLSHTWSVAVEAHFYLLVAPVLASLFTRLSLPRVLGVAVLLYLALALWRYHAGANGGWNEVYYRSDTRLAGLFAGVVFGVTSHITKDFSRVEVLRNYRVFTLVYCAFFAAVAVACLSLDWGHNDYWETPVIGLEVLTGLLLLFSAGSGEWWLRRYIVPLGRISYGLYLWHYPIFYWLRDRYDWDIVLVVGLPLSLLLALLSWNTVERWGNRQRVGHAHRQLLESRS